MQYEKIYLNWNDTTHLNYCSVLEFKIKLGNKNLHDKNGFFRSRIQMAPKIQITTLSRRPIEISCLVLFSVVIHCQGIIIKKNLFPLHSRRPDSMSRHFRNDSFPFALTGARKIERNMQVLFFILSIMCSCIILIKGIKKKQMLTIRCKMSTDPTVWSLLLHYVSINFVLN